MIKFSKSKEPRRNVKINSPQRPKTFNYSSGNNGGNSNRAQSDRGGKGSPQRPMGRRISTVINYLIAITLLIGAIYMSMLQTDAQVKIKGREVYPREKISYVEQINKQLKSSIFYKNKITFDSNKLAADIRKSFPEVDDIDINIALFRHRPVIEISLAEPANKLVTTDKIYILDEYGKALFEQKDASSELDTGSLLTINDASGHDIKLGEPALTELQINYIREIIGQTKAKQLKPEAFTLSNGGTGVNVKFSGIDYYVKFSFFADARQSSGAFIALHEQLKNSGPQPGLYVDVRIPDKAFIK